MTPNTPGTKWTVTFGKSTRVYYTEYHAEQFARALHLNGTKYKLEATK